MSLFSYFKISKPQKSQSSKEKAPVAPTPIDNNPPQNGNYSEPSPTASSRQSVYSNNRLDDIRHQVILNHLWQKQRGLMWIMDNPAQHEGVMVRRDRTEYLCRPPALASSAFGTAMKIMNVSVSVTL